jgi:hypothetical protein
MDVFQFIWLIVALLMALSSVAYAAWTEDKEPVFLIVIIILVSLLWPAILIIALVLAPFYSLYYFVAWLRKLYNKSLIK